MTDDGQTDDGWMGSPEWALQRIMAETGEDPVDAERTRRNLLEIDVSLRSALLAWWKSGEVDLDCEYAGWSIRRLIAGGWCKYVAHAFTWLDGLVRFPEDTLEMLSEPRCEIIVDEATKMAAIKKGSH